jgi:hypothetical protein
VSRQEPELFVEVLVQERAVSEAAMLGAVVHRDDRGKAWVRIRSFTSRGDLDIKGHGAMETWLLKVK